MLVAHKSNYEQLDRPMKARSCRMNPDVEKLAARTIGHAPKAPKEPFPSEVDKTGCRKGEKTCPIVLVMAPRPERAK
jgi:hypothetical protein